MTTEPLFLQTRKIKGDGSIYFNFSTPENRTVPISPQSLGPEDRALRSFSVGGEKISSAEFLEGWRAKN